MQGSSVIDADGHIVEDRAEFRRYLEAPYNQRSGPLTFSEPWDRDLRGTLPHNREWCPDSPTAQDWLRMMDDHNISVAYLYATTLGGVSRIVEPLYAAALCRAYNNYVHDQYARVSDRLKPLALIPPQDPVEAAKELRRAVTELKFPGAFIRTTGLKFPLGHSIYDPIYAEAERLGCMFAVHGTAGEAEGQSAGMFDTFAEVHTVTFPVGVLVQFTSMLFQGVPERFPKLRLGFLEIGCTWLPYWLNRMDEHWEKRGKIETPHLKRPPSECVRAQPIYFSIEAGETLLPETIKFVGEDHFLYATDIPHWDNEFPENIHMIEGRKDLSAEAKRKILHDNAQTLYRT
jgi:predicted TIM-barrel fold metal-dependent hydrolase